jgi:hypothetical protein
MGNLATRYVLFVFPFFALCQPVQASAWEICSMELRIINVLKRPYPQLQAEILKVSQRSTTAECPKEGATITFIPETTDYQSELPRRQWPQKGQSVHVNYQYLDGICKGDGHDRACRIKHYPLAGT